MYDVPRQEKQSTSFGEEPLYLIYRGGNTMSIKHKLRRSFQLLIALTVIACIVSFALLKVVDLIYGETIQQGLPQIEYTKDLERYIIEEKSAVES